MTGMKEGAGEDPFAEDSTVSKQAAVGPDDGEPEPSMTGGSDSPQFTIPYKFRREGVQDGRDRVPLFLHDETKTAERDALHQFENHFETNVSLTDLREALVMVGLEHLDEVESQLTEWGYGMTFDE